MSTPDDARPGPVLPEPTQPDQPTGPPRVPDAGPAPETPAPVPPPEAPVSTSVTPSIPPPMPASVVGMPAWVPSGPAAPMASAQVSALQTPAGLSAAPPVAPAQGGPPPPGVAAPPVSALSPSAPGYPAAPPPSSPVYPAQSGGHGAPPGPVQTTRVRRQRPLWVTVAVAAATALVISAGTVFGLSRLTDDSSTNVPRPASVATIGQTSSKNVPVDGSSVSQPDWERVSTAVINSVVAIRAGDAGGSGVIVSAEGDVITNNHVVAEANGDTMQVTLSDGRIYDATLVGADVATDLAVVRITNPPADLSSAVMGDSSSVVVGQQVMAVGNPMGMQSTVTTGVVSAVNRPMGEADRVVNTIQVDASVNPGNSGGPLFDGQGKMIGINSSIVTFATSSGQGGSIGLAFAIPVNLVQDISSQLINNSDHVARHAYLGVRMNDSVAQVDGANRVGAKVVRVEDGTPAAAAGLKEGDVVVAFNSAPLQDLSASINLTVSQSLTAFVRSYRSGDEVTLTVVRDGKALDFDVTLTSRPDEEGTSPSPEATP